MTYTKFFTALVLAIAVLFAIVFTAHAQATGYTFRIYGPSTFPTRVIALTPTQVTCNLPAQTGQQPRHTIVFDDPVNVNRFCRWTDSDAGQFGSLPNGSYQGTLTWTNAQGTSAESARAPFVRADPTPGPAVITGLSITP